MRGGLRWLTRPFQVICVLVAVLLTAAFSLHPGFAERAGGNAPIPDKPNLGSLGERLNSNTISIISGNPNATYLTIAYDLSDVLDDGDNFRVLPVVGKGGGQNINDVRFLKGIDLGITQSIILNEYRANNTIGSIDDKIDYIAKLFNEEMHVVVRADSGITSLEQLDGKKVNFSDVGSGSQLSGRDIFARLGIHPIEANLGQSNAVQKLKAGELAATILIAGKPAGLMGKLRASQGLRFLPVAFAKPLQSDYLPAVLSHADYPGMIEEGHDVTTIAVSAVLICFNWSPNSDRYRRIADFVDRFFSKLSELQKPPHHPKWRETNLAAVLPGWNRFPAATEWLKQHEPAQPAVDGTRQRFDQFLAQRSGDGASEADRDRLFRQFLDWQARERP